MSRGYAPIDERRLVAQITRLDVTVVPSGMSARWTDRMLECHVGTTIVRIVDADGVEGIAGVDSYSFAPADLSLAESVRSVAPALLGRDTDCREQFLQDMSWVGPPTGCQALLDVALWGVAAKRAGLPLYKLLGAQRDTLPAYASVVTLDSVPAYLEMADRVRGDSLQAMKVHAWGEPDRDLALFAALRAHDPDMTLMYDAECVYSRREALKVARGLEELDCCWFEAPLSDHDLTGYRELRASVHLPILPGGYEMRDVRQYAEALRDPPWTALRSEVGSTLGITGLVRLMRLAEAFDMNLEPVSYGHTSVQLAALHVMLAFSNASYFELPYPVEPWEYCVTTPVRWDDQGLVHAPQAAGLGLELDWEQVSARAAGSFVLAAVRAGAGGQRLSRSAHPALDRQAERRCLRPVRPCEADE
jgi:L-alanine-DL-glutamate epimerase-like enolase superfamily enzyme